MILLGAIIALVVFVIIFISPITKYVVEKYDEEYTGRQIRLATVIHKFDLQILEQYLKDISSFGTFSANFDADIKAMGNLNEAERVTTSGFLAINDFHIGKNRDNDYASFDKLAVAINEISRQHRKFLFDSVLLTCPYLKYERYDYLDNLQLL